MRGKRGFAWFHRLDEVPDILRAWTPTTWTVRPWNGPQDHGVPSRPPCPPRTLESHGALVRMRSICFNKIRNASLDAKQVILVTCVMKIRNVAHKGLRRFIEDDNPAALQPAVMPKLRRILSFLQDMEREEELRTVPSWKTHQLVGDRKGVWSLSVTKNWRITFRIDQATIEIVDLDYEDYH